LVSWITVINILFQAISVNFIAISSQLSIKNESIPIELDLQWGKGQEKIQKMGHPTLQHDCKRNSFAQ